jgi:pimeloyl-ACP methyl ester carboxylesterase
MEKTIEFRGGKLHYRLSGKGSPIMLLHGFGEDSRIWDFQLSYLSSHYLVLVPDIPGSGKSDCLEERSEKINGIISYQPSIEDLVQSIKFILDEEKISLCSLIGHSMGGYIALSFARQYPGSLNGLGLFHSTATADSEEKKWIREKGIAFIKQYGAAVFLRQTIPNLFSLKFQENHVNEVEAFLHQSEFFSNKALIQYYRAMMQRIDHKQVLSEFKSPVLIIIGEEDKTVLLQDVISQCYLPDICHVHIWKGVGHMGMLENPERSNEVLLKFLRHAHEN